MSTAFYEAPPDPVNKLLGRPLARARGTSRNKYHVLWIRLSNCKFPAGGGEEKGSVAIDEVSFNGAAGVLRTEGGERALR